MICPACHFNNPDGFAFCGKCGVKLAAAESQPLLITEADLARLRPYLTPTQLDALPPAALWRESDIAAVNEQLIKLLAAVTPYLPRHLIRTELAQLAEEPALSGGEFLNGALLFADISGFTAMSERLSVLGREGAEQITDIVNRYFGTMLKIIFDRGGDLFKFGGDALLVFFSDMESPDSGAARALRAGWNMQQAMSDFTKIQTRVGDFPLRMKIGLNTGSIYTARLGTATDRQFIVTGATVNATAHAQALASAGQILITPKVYAALDQAASPFRFSPGPDGHFLLDQLVGSSETPAPVLDRPGVPAATAHTPSASLRQTLLTLDRLTPYLPANLLPRLLSTSLQQPTHGEHRLVGVMFANFIGASELIERLGPEQADEIARYLNDYFVKMQAAVVRYGGMIDTIDLAERGDKIMAIFGAPLAHEDDAERTVRAALDMQAAEKDLAALQIVQRIGVNTGLVFAGHVGSNERREYSVIGDVVNLAARLAGAANDGELLLSNAIRRKASAYFEIADRGEIMVKGKTKPISIYSIVGRRAQPEPVRGIRGLRSPLVGRDKEQQVIRALADGIRHGRGSILSIIGEVGLGKSRLINDLRSEVVAAGCLCLKGHCLSYTQNVSYSAFTEIVHGILGILATDSTQEASAKLRQRLDDLLPGQAVEDILPYLAHFLSLPLVGAMAERVAYLEGEALQRQVIRAVVVLLEQMALRQPLMLIFDDLHWADSASLALLERVLAVSDRAPALICLLYRPDRAHGCWTLGEAAARNYPHRHTEITLRPLDVQRGEDHQLVSNLLALESLPAVLVQLIGRAEGNPFYIEEIIRALIDRGAIVRSDNRWQLVGEIELQVVPDNLQSIIMARIDRLLDEARQTLQVASVVGRTFQYGVLHWLARAASLAMQIDTSLAALQRAELVHEQTRVPELEYGFTQAMFREVAYESLLLHDRRIYHRLVGQQLEEMNAEAKREEVYELLAHHYHLSDDQAKALFYLIKAADKTRLAYANKEAIVFYRQAEAVAETIGSDDDRAAIAEGLGDVLYHIGEYDEALAQFARALRYRTTATQQADLHRRIGAVYEKRGDYEQALTGTAQGLQLLTPDQTRAVEMARLLTLECRVHHQQGRFEPAIEDGEHALTIIEDTSHYQEIAQAHNELGNAYDQFGQPEKAIFHFERGLLILERIGDEYGAAKIYNNLAIIYYQTDLARSAGYFTQSLQTMQRLGDVWGESTAYQNLGIVQYAQGHYAQAIEYYTRSLSMKERLGDNLGIADCHINLGEVYRARGDLAQAIANLEQGLAVAQAIGANQAEAECHRQLAECYLEIHEPGRALANCEEALGHARQSGDRKEEGIIERVLGNAHTQLNDLSTATIHFSNSTAILRELSREYDLATALYDYAQALKLAGQADQARQQLLEARILFEHLNLPLEQAKVQAALEQLP